MLLKPVVFGAVTSNGTPVEKVAIEVRIPIPREGVEERVHVTSEHPAAPNGQAVNQAGDGAMLDVERCRAFVAGPAVGDLRIVRSALEMIVDGFAKGVLEAEIQS